jgi:adenylate kinase family enzyme
LCFEIPPERKAPQTLGAIKIDMVTILFLDDNISKAKTENAICSTFDLTLFDFTQELRKEMKSFLDEGRLIPTATLEKFFVKHIAEAQAEKILLSGYPMTLEQFQRLEKLLQTLQLPIHQFWYVRQRDPERFMIEYLQDQKENEWLKKYGDEFITKRQQSFAERRAYIDTIRQAASKYIWKIVDMDYQPNLTEQYIKQKIHNRA